MPPTDPRRHYPATARNREAILAVLGPRLADGALLLEVASGSGEHAAWMAPRLPGVTWQPSDYEAEALAGIDAHAGESGCARIRPALQLDASAAEWPIDRADAILCCNMIHIAPWSAALGLLAGAGRILSPGGRLFLYGPFMRGGVHTAPSNAAFDADLRARDRDWGVREMERVAEIAAGHGLHLEAAEEMPANNFTLIFARQPVQPSGTVA